MKDHYDFSKGTRGKWYRKDAVMRLPEAIADIKRKSHANGPTDDDIDTALDAWRNAGNSNPSKSF